jgi:hypothetical protein
MVRHKTVQHYKMVHGTKRYVAERNVCFKKWYSVAKRYIAENGTFGLCSSLTLDMVSQTQQNSTTDGLVGRLL